MSAKLHIVRLLSLIGIFLHGSIAVAAPPGSSSTTDFASGTVLVAFQPGTPGADISAAHRQTGGRVVKTLGALGVDVVAVTPGTELAAVQTCQQTGGLLRDGKETSNPEV